MQIVEEKDELAFDFDLLDPTKLIPEELVPVAARRQADAQPQPRQLLRRDRAGRLPRRARRAGHRLHQRPAAAGPALLLHRHAAHPAGRAELPRDPDQPPGRARAQQPARRPHAPDDQRGQSQLRPELARRRLPVPGRHARPAATSLFRSAVDGAKSASAAQASSTTSARPRCSSTASPHPSSSTSSRPSASSSAR